MVEGPYRTYSELMRRTFQIDVEQCDKCGDAEEWWSFDHSSASSKDHGRLKLRSLVIEAHNIERLLRYLGEPLEPPKRAPARDPPYFKSQVLRRKFGELN